jgi:protein-L-isoaspartate(D-aspartate) O-methyltransferase
MESNDELVDYLVRWGILKDSGVENAMRSVDRAGFVPESVAYSDSPQGIGHGQTISAPHMVAIMTQHMKLEKKHKVLEVGAGSGYQAAILGVMVKEVYTVERIPELAKQAEQKLGGYKNVYVVCTDGSKGLPEKAPFDRILVTCAARRIPEKLREQLTEGGFMVLPVGSANFCSGQKLLKVTRDAEEDLHCDCVFVPLVEGEEL